MKQGLLKRLALAAPLVVCLPLCALGGDGGQSADDDSPKIFEEFSLTSASEPAATSPTTGVAPAAASLFAPPAPGPAAAGSAPCVNGPQACDGGCCDNNCCQPNHLFFAGVDALFLHASTHGMGSEAAASRSGSTDFTSTSEIFDRWTYAPRIYAGVQDDCWAVLGRFFYLSDSTGGLDPFFPAGRASGEADFERLKAYTIDFEVSRMFCVYDSKLNFYLGGRYASFEAGQGVDYTRLTSATEIAYMSEFSNFAFNGLGVTTGLQGRTPIGCNTCISLLWGLRGSVLWGNSDRAVQTSASLIDTNASATSVNSALSRDHDTAFIVEGMVGAQWDHQLQCMPMSAYLRIAFEWQYWDLGDNGSVSATSFALSNTGSGHANASVGDVNANLIGFTVGTGFNW